MSTSTKVMGAAIKRREDPRLMTGEAKFLDDVKLVGMVHAAILRSPYAHARIKRINTERAKKHPGVVAVFTGEDFKDLPPLPCAWLAEAGRIQNNVNTPRVLEINEVVIQLERLLRRLIGEDVEMVLLADAAAGLVKADPGQIEQVLLNLAVNARDAMPQGGKLTITTRNVLVEERPPSCHDGTPPGAYVMLEASDTGCGERGILTVYVLLAERSV